MKKKQIVAIILIIFFLFGIGWFFYARNLSVNYLIPGVPYNGIYNLFFRQASTPAISSVMDILGYWGDNRFSLQDLRGRFSVSVNGGNATTTTFNSTLNIQKFFQDNGYETYRWASSQPGNEIKEIKKFVNSGKKIPVIVYQKRSPDKDRVTQGFRVIIGIFDKNKKVVVHDHNFGNNYEISYEDFEKMFQPSARAILAVWPSDKIRGVIAGPNYKNAYPPRLETMDKVGPLLAGKGADIITYSMTSALNYERSNALHEEFIDDPNFQYFPPAFQVMTLSWLAQKHVFLNQFVEAIKIINERVLPINKKLDESPQGWYIPPFSSFAFPYYVLSQAYLKEGKRDLAIDNYKKMKLISASIREKVGEDNYFGPPEIAELEKAISSKK